MWRRGTADVKSMPNMQIYVNELKLSSPICCRKRKQDLMGLNALNFGSKAQGIITVVPFAKYLFNSLTIKQYGILYKKFFKTFLFY